MKVHAVKSSVDAGTVLAGAQFADAFSITVVDGAPNARQAAERMFGRSPHWVKALMTLRDRIVAPFGLKTEKIARMSTDRVGMFPVISETPARIVAGLNDKHLDFRVIVDVSDAGSGRNVTATTLVLTHNPLGRVYLAIILPFHRLIVPSMLRQI